MKFKTVAAIAFSMFLLGCQRAPLHPSMAPIDPPPAARPLLGQIDVIASEQMKTIIATSMPSPGLTPASAIVAGFDTAWLKDRVELVNKAFPTFDYPAEVLKATQQAFAGVDNVRVLPTVARAPGDSVAMFASATSDAVLTFSVTTMLSDRGALLSSGWLFLSPKSDALQQLTPNSNDSSRRNAGNLLFRRYTQVETPFSGADNPAKVRAVFVGAARELAEWAANEVKALKLEAPAKQ